MVGLGASRWWVLKESWECLMDCDFVKSSNLYLGTPETPRRSFFNPKNELTCCRSFIGSPVIFFNLNFFYETRTCCAWSCEQWQSDLNLLTIIITQVYLTHQLNLSTTQATCFGKVSMMLPWNLYDCLSWTNSWRGFTEVTDVVWTKTWASRRWCFALKASCSS